MYARVQMSWLRDNGVPEDAISNTWHFSDFAGTALGSSEAEDVADALNTFYNSLAGHYAAYMGTQRTINVYDMQDTVPRVPVYENTYTPTAPTNEGIPAELAICLSYAAATGSGLNARRRRGRIYLGPLAQATFDAGGGTGDRRVNSSTISAINTAYDSLRTAVLAVGIGFFHSVYSPTTDAGATLGEAFSSVASAYVDNAYDIQRRRGQTTTTRTVIMP
jgi:hypothetical protein